jgi:site-specific recombinase XerD
MNYNPNNELMKRKHEEFLKETMGYSRDTIKFRRRVLDKYDAFTNHENYAKFNKDKAISFKDYLKKNSKSISSFVNYMKELKKFFFWLSEQRGYKLKITKELVEYLNVLNEYKAIAKSRPPRKYPNIEYVLNLTKSIKVRNEVDMRGRSIIAMLCLTGIRYAALLTIPIKCFDRKNLIVHQDPNVKTKLKKQIISKLFNFNDELVNYVLEWIDYLKQKGFARDDPLFPCSKNNKSKHQLCFEESTEVEAKFWTGSWSIRNILKRRVKEAGVEYFQPHTYRHLAIELAMSKAKSGEEIKAISQNFGHEKIPTTFRVYGNYQSEDLIKKLNEIDNRRDDEMDIKKALEVITKGVLKNKQ